MNKFNNSAQPDANTVFALLRSYCRGKAEESGLKEYELAECFNKCPVDRLKDLMRLFVSLCWNPEYAYNRVRDCSMISWDGERAAEFVAMGVSPNPADCMSCDSSCPVGFVKCVERGDAKSVEFFLEHGANPDSGTVYESALTIAVRRKDATILRMLVDAGADLNLNANGKGRCAQPLRVALADKDYDLARYLISKGADPNLTYIVEACSAQSLNVNDFPEDIRHLFEADDGLRMPKGVSNPEAVSQDSALEERTLYELEIAYLPNAAENHCLAAWARKTYQGAESAGCIPVWISRSEAGYISKLAAFWLYVNCANKTDWPLYAGIDWSVSYWVAQKHDFWRCPPPVVRLVDWASYLNRLDLATSSKGR